MWIDGKQIAESVRNHVRQQVAELQTQTGLTPGLATVLVGQDPASQTYVKSKRKACAEAGITSFAHELPAEISQSDLEALIKQLNADPAVHGILVQLPLPKHLNEQAILDLISLHKDVDGFHPMNIGALAMKGRQPHFIPCTPHGVMVLLEQSGVELAGKHAVVLGRSNIVGIPVSLLLLKANATVTIAHSQTHDLPSICRQADVLVAAVGKPHMVKANWVKPGAVVIDVGINRVEDSSKQSGLRLVGDVDTESVAQVASLITPVPGGVGPMTIAMLLQNTLKACQAVSVWSSC
jgi:5,10-methylene-tetrahydrofolate dehydrogenase/methenyl tetrahydrofolate cyclohydrolase